MPPELRLLITLAGSGVMFHMTNALCADAPELGKVVRENPELMRHMAQATMKTMSKGSGGGGIAGMFSNLFARSPEQPREQPSHRGPEPPRVEPDAAHEDDDIVSIFSTATEAHVADPPTPKRKRAPAKTAKPKKVLEI